MAAGAQVLCVEDDPCIGRLVSAQLGEMGHTTEWVADGAQGLQRMLDKNFDLIILDLNLPSLNGFKVCSRMRAHNRHTPVIMLTARTSKRDVIRGLELGADEYITKPFSTLELTARIDALFRRIAVDREHQDISVEPFQCCGFTIDPPRREILRDNVALILTAKEFDLLTLFARSPGRVYSRSEILARVWGQEFDGYDHTVNTHINRLRNKVEPDPSDPTYIQTVWGVGYRFSDDLNGCTR